jgi:hypothetical protein
VKGLGFRVKGLGLRVQGIRFWFFCSWVHIYIVRIVRCKGLSFRAQNEQHRCPLRHKEAPLTGAFQGLGFRVRGV